MQSLQRLQRHVQETPFTHLYVLTIIINLTQTITANTIILDENRNL